jgi:hypothetical protein
VPASESKTRPQGQGAKAAGPKKERGKVAAAARAETAEPQPKTITFRDLELTVAAELPKTLLWDMAAAQQSDVFFFQLVQSVISPEQLPEVRQLLAESDDDPNDFAGELLQAVLVEHGMALGESSASQDS